MSICVKDMLYKVEVKNYCAPDVVSNFCFDTCGNGGIDVTGEERSG